MANSPNVGLLLSGTALSLTLPDGSTSAVTLPTVSSGGSSGVAPLARGSIVQPVGITTALGLASPMASITLPPFGPVTTEPGSQILVDASHLHQEWFGFGAAMTNASAVLLMNMAPADRTALLTEAYGTNGMNIVRLCMGDSDFTSNTYQTYGDIDTAASDPNNLWPNFSIAMDEPAVIPVCLEILRINPRVRFLLTPWSPPVRFKTIASLLGANSPFFINTAANNASYAQYFVKTYQAFAAFGIRPWAFCLQNEPNGSPPLYPGCRFNAADMAALAIAVRAAFDAINVFPEIFGGDCSWGDTGTFVSGTLGVATSAPAYTGAAYHGYDGNAVLMAQDKRAYNKPIFLTEWATFFADSVNLTLNNVAGVVGTTSIRAGISAAVWWNFILDQNGAPFHQSMTAPSTCRGTITINNSTGVLTRNVEYYAMAMVGRYVQPGAYVCRSTSLDNGMTATDVQHVAWVNPDTSRVSFMYNPASVARTIALTDSVTGETTIRTIPSKSMDLVTWGPGNIVTAGAFIAPSAIVMAVPTLVNGQPVLAWTLPTTKGSTDIGGVILYRGTTAGGEGATPLIVLPGTATGYTDTTTTTGATYYYYAVAFGALKAPNSNEVTIATTAVKPGIPSFNLTAGNGNVTVNATATTNGGSAITGFDIWDSTTVGAEVKIASNVAVPYVITATNGTPIYVEVAAVNAIGSSTLATEQTATPTASSSSTAPAHAYVAALSTASLASSGQTSATNVTDGFLELSAWHLLSSYTPSANYLVLGNVTSNTAGGGNAVWGMGVYTDGEPAVYTMTAAKAKVNYAPGSAYTLTSAAPSNTLGIHWRFVINSSTVAVVDSLGVSHPAGTAQFYTSLDDINWTTLGPVLTVGTTGFSQPAAPSAFYSGVGAGTPQLTATLFKVKALGSGGRVLLNPDFTIQASGTTTFADTAPVPVTWAVTSPGSIT